MEDEEGERRKGREKRREREREGKKEEKKITYNFSTLK